MRGDSESRSRYLSLALISRKTIESLIGLVAGQPIDNDLEISLNKLLAGTSREGNENFVSHLESSDAWTYFEELSTVDELKSETGTIDLDEIVTSILRNGKDRVQNSKRLINFLTALEGRALQRYTDSMELQLL